MQKTKVIRLTVDLTVDEDLEPSDITVHSDDVIDGFCITRNASKFGDDITNNFKMHDVEVVEITTPELAYRAFGFSVIDIMQQAEDDDVEITEEEALEILKMLSRKGDCSIGVNWDTISMFIDAYVNKHTWLKPTL